MIKSIVVLERLREHARELERLLACCDGSGRPNEAFALAWKKCSLDPAEIEGWCATLLRADPVSRTEGRRVLEKIVALNAYVRDAVEREQASITSVLGRTRGALVYTGSGRGADATGEGCDVEG
jgi:hypothetical protein